LPNNIGVGEGGCTANTTYVRSEDFYGWPTSPDPSPLLSTDFPCDPSPFSSCSYKAGFILDVLDIRVLVLAHAGSSLVDFFIFSSTLKMEAIRSSEKSVNTISTGRHIPEDCLPNTPYVYRYLFDIFCNKWHHMLSIQGFQDGAAYIEGIEVQTTI
jgi:hypothetical protein